jgi:hypothetical protein
MIITVLLLLLQLSFTMHIYFLVQYVVRMDKKFLRWFVNTAVSNIFLAGLLTILAIYRPELIRNINLKFLLWIISGFIMLIMLLIKVSIFRNIMKRSRDPANYHLNYFGKKVLHSSVVSRGEIYIFFFTIPMFLFAGAYFLARMLNLIMFGYL